jgi:hypothetical protein
MIALWFRLVDDDLTWDWDWNLHARSTGVGVDWVIEYR